MAWGGSADAAVLPSSVTQASGATTLSAGGAVSLTVTAGADDPAAAVFDWQQVGDPMSKSTLAASFVALGVSDTISATISAGDQPRCCRAATG